MKIEIVRSDPRQPDVRKLIEDLDRYQLSLYPAESNHLVDVETLARPEFHFVCCRVNDEAKGIGGMWLHEDYGEVKRVYVDPPARGLGLSRRIMAALEAAALAEGRRIARLETGIYQPEALGLYEALGYVRCAAFGGYPAHDPLSVFMEKRLA